MNSLESYEYVTKIIKIKEVIKKQVIEVDTVNIGVKNKRTGIVLPHPISDFVRVKYEYAGNTINSMLPAARVICRFLNFINEEILKENKNFLPLVSEGLKGLKVKHGSLFITHLTKNGKTPSTVDNYENYLKEFYHYLFEKGIITPEISIQTVVNKNKKVTVLTPFKHASLGTRYPSKVTVEYKKPKLKDFGENKGLLITEFLLKAKEVAPDVAFGIALQIFGGLRRGEVVNLLTSSLKIKYRESMTVEIRDNRNILFRRLKDKSKENPKRLNYLNVEMANQTILDNNLVWDLYDAHMKDLERKLKAGELTVPGALFVDEDGNPISGSVWDRRFRKVKEVLKEELLKTEGRQNDYNLLNSSYWNSHIGRGLFTNILFDMGLTVTQIAIARGDTSINSALEYVDVKLSTKAIQEMINELKAVPVEQIGKVDSELIHKHWKEGVLKRDSWNRRK